MDDKFIEMKDIGMELDKEDLEDVSGGVKWGPKKNETTADPKTAQLGRPIFGKNNADDDVRGDAISQFAPGIRKA
jgi:hypothetical protein